MIGTSLPLEFNLKQNISICTSSDHPADISFNLQISAILVLPYGSSKNKINQVRAAANSL